MKILDFDKFGRYIKSYDSIEQARVATGEKHIIRNLFREGSVFCSDGDGKKYGHIFTFDFDERIIRDENGAIIKLDCIDINACQVRGINNYYSRYISIEEGIKQTEDGKFVLPNYKKVDNIFDKMKTSIYCYRVVSNRTMTAKYLIPVGKFNTVAEAREATGAKCIFSVLLGEDGTTSDKDDEFKYFFTKRNLGDYLPKIKKTDGQLCGKSFWRCGKKDSLIFISDDKEEVLNVLFSNKII